MIGYYRIGRLGAEKQAFGYVFEINFSVLKDKFIKYYNKYI